MKPQKTDNSVTIEQNNITYLLTNIATFIPQH